MLLQLRVGENQLVSEQWSGNLKVTDKWLENPAFLHSGGQIQT